MRRILCGPHVEWLAWVLGAIVVVLAVAKSPAHEAPMGWEYDAACCHNQDCKPLPEDQTPKPLDGGDWRLSTGEIVPKSKVKFSPDGLFHLCRFHATGAVLCLYTPPNGS